MEITKKCCKKMPLFKNIGLWVAEEKMHCFWAFQICEKKKKGENHAKKVGRGKSHRENKNPNTDCNLIIAKPKKSDDQKNIGKYRLAVNIT